MFSVACAVPLLGVVWSVVTSLMLFKKKRCDDFINAKQPPKRGETPGMGHRGIAATSPCGYSQRAAEPSSGAIRVRRPHGPVGVAATSGWRCPPH